MAEARRRLWRANARVAGMSAAHEPDKLKVFISYSRRDVTAADALADALSSRQFEVTIDRRDLPFGEKWQAELAEFIRLSDTVIWLVSDASVRSKWVNWELDEVTKQTSALCRLWSATARAKRCPANWVRSTYCPPKACLRSSAISTR
jgi:hypothetical protein